MEDEQDYMGLYEAELSKQIHLRNKQQKEWEIMKKKMGMARNHDNQKEGLTDKQEDDRIEMEETSMSKKVAASLASSAASLGDGNCDEDEVIADVIQKAVDLLLNQNGKIL